MTKLQLNQIIDDIIFKKSIPLSLQEYNKSDRNKMSLTDLYNYFFNLIERVDHIQLAYGTYQILDFIIQFQMKATPKGYQIVGAEVYEKKA